MKRTSYIFIAVVASVLLFSNFGQKETRYVFTTLLDEPRLPEIPFEYSAISVPQHLRSPDPDIGYGASGLSNNTILNIEDDKATLGRVLFYDKKLSALENISCASCHLQEFSFADNKQFSEGANQDTKRNSMALNDLMWTNRSHFFWDMSEHSFFDMIRLPLKDENEVGADMADVIIKLEDTNYYNTLFTKTFGSTEVTEDKIVDALVHFISSMVSFDSRFDQGAVEDFESFTQLEMEGLELFSENCATCHSQGHHNPNGVLTTFVDFTNPDNSPLDFFPEIFNNGLVADPNDEGAAKVDPYFKDLFKIPTLRNVEMTAPYMHDGRFETLRDVINHYSEDVQSNKWTEAGLITVGGFGFEEQEKQALEAFLLTLTDENLLTHRQWSDPFDALLNVEEYVTFEELVVSPNPMSDYALIKFENDASKRTSIKILSASGQVIISDIVTSNSYELRKDGLLIGTYIVEIIQDKKRSIQKIIVQ